MRAIPSAIPSPMTLPQPDKGSQPTLLRVGIVLAFTKASAHSPLTYPLASRKVGSCPTPHPCIKVRTLPLCHKPLAAPVSLHPVSSPTLVPSQNSSRSSFGSPNGLPDWQLSGEGRALEGRFSRNGRSGVERASSTFSWARWQSCQSGKMANGCSTCACIVARVEGRVVADGRVLMAEGCWQRADG